MRLLSDKRFLLLLVASSVILAVQYSFASSESGSSGHGDGVLEILIALIVILLAAKIGGDLFERVHQPAVLGELVMGIIIGNL
ncbi:MAG: hypothetical protein IIA17_02040, partial [candidate division Zixibacteria bacterium]|nr:hypothetical protein [candidate division Zixibacteria bacterium]